MRKVIEFTDTDEECRWRDVNDGVMGGISSGGFHVEGGVGVFSGELSLAHGGGFASVRRQIRTGELVDAAGIVLRVCGDGRRYQCRVGTEDVPPGVSYAAGFDTVAGRWLEIPLAWEMFAAVFRGQAVPDAPPLSPERINRLGFLLADRRAGPFRLEVASIRGT
ncbi:MAG: CIA30 family protein [Guyparkeria sp.]